MKKLTAVLLSLALVFSLCACGAQSSEAVAPASGSSAAPAESAAPEATAAPSECSLHFTRDEFPRLDGSTSLAPLGKALASLMLGETEDEAADLISFSRTTASFRALMYDECDLLLVSEPDSAVFDEMEEYGFSCDMAQIATEGLVFVVNENNPVDSLTTEQLRGIYSGEITNWSEVGGEDAPIAAFQRNAGAGSQVLMEKLVMNGTEMAEAPTEYIATSMGDLMSGVKSYDNSSNAIGYSVYYYANDMQMARGLKIISVDGVAPSPESIRSGEYPHRNAYYTVVSSEAAEDSPARQIYNWLQSDEGQALVYREGYVSVTPFEGESAAEQTPVEQYTRLREEAIPDLEAGDYGAVYPFVGEILYSDDSYQTGCTYGMVDENGCIVADATYTGVSVLRNYLTGEDMPFYLLSRSEPLDVEPDPDYMGMFGNTVYALASLDGSFVTECSYTYFDGFGDVILAKSDDGLTAFDTEGNVLFTEADLPFEEPLCSWAAPTYGDGVYAFGLSESEDSVIYRLTDSDLVPFGGTFSYVEGFRGGVSAACAQGSGLYGVINTRGEWIIEPTYSWVSRDEYGVLCAERADGGSDYFDTDGTMVFTTETSSGHRGYGYEVYSSDWMTSTAYAPDGTFLCELGYEDGDWQYTGLGSVFYCCENGSASLWDASSGRTQSVPADGSVSALASYDTDGTRTADLLVAFSSGYDHAWLIRGDLSTAEDLGSRSVSLLTDGFTGEMYVQIFSDMTGRAACELRDMDGNTLGSFRGDVSIWNGHVLETQETACTLYAPNGDTVFCRIPDSLGAD